MHNKAQQFAADGRRTPFPWLLRRHSKAAAVLRRYWPGIREFLAGGVQRPLHRDWLQARSLW